MIRVPEETPVDSSPPAPTEMPTRATSFVAPPAKTRRPKAKVDRIAAREGLVRVPGALETNMRGSLLYPFWGPHGISLLVFVPPGLWITALPTLGALSFVAGPAEGRVLGAILGFPAILGFLLVLGYALLFLGRVLISSVVGEIHQPRQADLEIGEILAVLLRWLAAGAVAVAVGVVPMALYWVYCGDVDLFDRIILAELGAIGAAYSQMALLSALLHESPLAANPITVLPAIRRVGWGYARPCLVSGAALMIVLSAFVAAFRSENEALAAAGLYLGFVLSIYAAMVCLRVLGLFYHRNAAKLGWYRPRPRWGV